MADADRIKWDAKHAAGEPGTMHPAAVLVEYAHLLPPRGHALDLACGQGANALFLASRGLVTAAWDISGVAIDRLTEAANQAGLQLQAELRDVVERPPLPRSFDVITVSRFLDRGLISSLVTALRPDGLVFYQTFLSDSETGPRNPEFRVRRNELPELFATLRVLAYHERDTGGEPVTGLRSEAMLVAQKRTGD